MNSSPPPEPPRWSPSIDYQSDPYDNVSVKPLFPVNGHTNTNTKRFYTLSTPTEYIESYRPGSYHPIDIGDSLSWSYQQDSSPYKQHHQRYTIIRKLGYGHFSTIWLADDRKYEQYVAIKILKAYFSSVQREIGIYNHLQHAQHQQQIELSHGKNYDSAASKQNFCLVPAIGSHNVIELLDSFELSGPNGVHLCLVLQPCGPSLSDVLEFKPDYEHKFKQQSKVFFRHADERTKINLSYTCRKKILKKVISAISFMHENGVAHGNIHPRNILFKLSPNVHSVRESDIKQSDRIPIYRLDRKPDPWAPRYIESARPLFEYTSFNKGDADILVSDLGQAFYINDPATSVVVPILYSAPEVILEDKIDEKIDIWSFGCLIYWLLTLNLPFNAFPWGLDEEQLKLECLISMELALGRFPADSPHGSKLHSHPNYGNRYKEHIEEDGEPSDLRSRFLRDKPIDISSEEAELIVSLLRAIFQYKKSNRPTAADILKHTWFDA